jgi:DNA polymerase-3 subunit epsilon
MNPAGSAATAHTAHTAQTAATATSPVGTAEIPIERVRFAVVDVETSGLSTRSHHVLQVAVVTVDGAGTEIDRWSSLVRPRHRWWFRLGPRHIHGLSRAALRDAPSARSVLADLSRRLEGSTFTAHNAGFDAAFLQRLARRSGATLDLGPQLCTLRMSRRLDPERQQSHRLGDLTARYGVTNSRPHDALEDALATAAVLPHLLRAHGLSTSTQLADFTSP